MNAPQNFRSAFNGFHREDVVNYISYITNRHDTLTGELRAEIQELKAQLVGMDETADSERLEALNQEREAAEELLTELNRENDTLQAEKNALEETVKRMQTDLSAKDAAVAELQHALLQKDALLEELRRELEMLKTAPVPEKKNEATLTDELNAYRRAERTERRARERVNQMFDQVNGTLAEASVRAEQTAAQVAELTAKVGEDLEQLHRAIEAGEQTLTDVAQMLRSVRPESDE